MGKVHYREVGKLVELLQKKNKNLHIFSFTRQFLYKTN